jgi:hypothetical protein
MPTVMTHAALAVGLGRIFTGRPLPLLFWCMTGSLAMLPDIDVLAFRFGIPYGAVFGHRGLAIRCRSPSSPAWRLLRRRIDILPCLSGTCSASSSP